MSLPGVVDAEVELNPDPARVVGRLFLPGESTPGGTSRTDGVLSRVLAVDASRIAAEAQRIVDRFDRRHVEFTALLRANAEAVRGVDAASLTADQITVIGATFTAEYSVEGISVCNPSVVEHPDQSGVAPGGLRVILSLRTIGESHVSSIQFAEAIIGPGRTWSFAVRSAPLHLPRVSDGTWEREHLVRALEHDGGREDLVRSLVQRLPARFGTAAVEDAVQHLPASLLHQPHARSQADRIRVVAGSAYRAVFDEGSPVSARVLLPYADEERHGVEDARFVRVDEGGAVSYRGTFTAYDGNSIGSRLLVTADFRDFEVHRLTGVPATTKGMALFPRTVDGQHLALSRTDGETTGLCRSADGLHWGDEVAVHRSAELWDVVQGGNCGSPIETEAGWLVLTHGVGPMREYVIGAILLDLDDPATVIGVLREPLIDASGADRNGYVPNVVYTCGAIIHDGVLWIPYGVADQRIRVASAPVAEVLAGMRPPTG